MPETRAEEFVDRLWDLYSESYSPFPSENIGMEDGQDTSLRDAEFQKSYWQKTYGGQQAFVCLIRTVLSQNTSDKASQPAHDSLMARYGDGDLAASLADAEQPELAETISSAGLYNQKSVPMVIVRRRTRRRTRRGGS